MIKWTIRVPSIKSTGMKPPFKSLGAKSPFEKDGTRGDFKPLEFSSNPPALPFFKIFPRGSGFTGHLRLHLEPKGSPDIF